MKYVGFLIDPSLVIFQVHRYSNKFKGTKKEDAYEFLYYMLDGMHNELNRVKNKPEDIPIVDEFD